MISMADGNECAIQDRMQSNFEMHRRSNSMSLFKTILIETNHGVYRTIDNDAKTQITTVGILRKEVVKWEERSRWIRRNAQRKEPRLGESDWIVWNIFKTLILPLGESKILKVWKTVTQWPEFGLCEDKQTTASYTANTRSKWRAGQGSNFSFPHERALPLLTSKTYHHGNSRGHQPLSSYQTPKFL